MALTLAVSVPEGVHGDLVPGAYKEIVITITDTSYSTGGDAFGLTQLNTLVPALFIYDIAVINPWTTGVTSAIAAYNTATGKLQAFGTAVSATGLTEIAAAQNIGTATLKVRYR
jgi:hypothetical protein